MQLPPMQRKVLDYLKTRHRSCLPEPAEVARDLGVHLTTLIEHLRALDKKGLIHYRSRGVGRSPIIELPLAAGVPLLGDIPAGSVSEALEHPEGYLALEGDANMFALRVHGDSMADLIQPGDVVLLAKDKPARSGNICAVRIDGADVTLKYLEWQGEQPKTLTLRPHNPQYSTLELAIDEVQIDGVYCGLLRGDVLGMLYKDVEDIAS